MPALDSTVQAGLVRFEAGEFHAAHDAWEEGWRTAQGAERHLLQALVQLAAAFHQWARRKPAGAATLFGRARAHLLSIPSTLLGVEVSELELELELEPELEPEPPLPPELELDEEEEDEALLPPSLSTPGLNGPPTGASLAPLQPIQLAARFNRASSSWRRKA